MTNKPSCGCSCNTVPTIIFPCSGAADVGEIADKTARALTKNGAGKMFCLAGIGGNVNGIVESTKAANKILVIDGCSVDCAKKTLERAGINSFNHLRITDLGFKKGTSDTSDASIETCMNKCKEHMCS